ncbi:uncharacterized protein LOC128676082 [Plodia interpunctella]|uniref:uncharacterized protein LOC128676082 n=1 Tax=Plodia interpunctella TaxID=58824 RepID=UPI0023679387|nr:uncharacterized protein LOC128676082 [Plodia interpunctella]
MKELTKIERKQLKRKRDNYVRKLKRNKQINDYLRSKLRDCYSQGLPYILNEEIHCVERLFWAASFICCLGLVGSLITSQYARYFRDPVVMSVEMDYFNWNIPYPAITLCAKDMIDEEDLENVVNDTLENSGVDLTSAIKSMAAIGLDKLETIDFNDAMVSQHLEPRDLRALTSILFKKFNNDSLTTSTNWPISVNFVLTELGMCHVVNSNVAFYDDPSIAEEKTIYEKNNIDLSVFDKDFFVQFLDYSEEYKLFIHHPDDIALISTPHHEVSKNYVALAFKVWSTRVSDAFRSLSPRYRNCRQVYLTLNEESCLRQFPFFRFLNEPISKRYPVYSYNHCLLECRVRMMQKLCRCVPHFYKFLAHENVCSLKQLKCIKQHKDELVKLSTTENTRNRFTNQDDLPKSPRDCNCLSNCENDVYLKDIETDSPPQENDRVRIGISSFPKVRVVREIIFSAYDVILRGCGVMNLIMGTSVISLAELFLIIIKITAIKTFHFIEPKLQTLRLYIVYLIRNRNEIN